jgi:hypothetical protein
LPGQFRFSPHLRARKIKLPGFFGYSVVKYRLKTKRAATFKVSFENFLKSPLLKQFRVFYNFKKLKLAKFYVSGAETYRSRFSKSVSPRGLSRRVSVDNSHYPHWHAIRQVGFR